MELLLFVAAAVRISVPYALASLGACFSERGGVINIALEGIMLNGALAYTLGAHASGSAVGASRPRSSPGCSPPGCTRSSPWGCARIRSRAVSASTCWPPGSPASC